MVPAGRNGRACGNHREEVRHTEGGGGEVVGRVCVWGVCVCGGGGGGGKNKKPKAETQKQNEGGWEYHIKKN